MTVTGYLTQTLPILETLKPHFTKPLPMNCFLGYFEACNREG